MTLLAWLLVFLFRTLWHDDIVFKDRYCLATATRILSPEALIFKPHSPSISAKIPHFPEINCVFHLKVRLFDALHILLTHIPVHSYIMRSDPQKSLSIKKASACSENISIHDYAASLWCFSAQLCGDCLEQLHNNSFNTTTFIQPGWWP